MSKKKPTNNQAKLTPENFIRKRARNLPIHKCYISDDWKENGECNIIIERKHGNGNITLGVFLVDLFCLGVKDTFYQYNISELEEEEFLGRFTGDNKVTEAGYNLVHNIILSAVEFAEDYGFKTHKDFERITQYILAEDTEDIPLMEIECGKDGKPFFVASDDMNEKEISRIISTLEKTAGPGNYSYLLNDEPENYGFGDDKPENYDFLDDEPEEKRISDVVDKETLESWKEKFLEGLKPEKSDLNDDPEFTLKTTEIIDTFYEDEINSEFFVLEDAFGDVDIMTEAVPSEFLGLQHATNKDDVEKARELIPELAEYNDDFSKLSKELMKAAPNLPVSQYFQIKYKLYEGNEKVCLKLLKKARVKFPDYPPFEFLSLFLEGYDDDFQMGENFLNYDLAAFYDNRQSFFKCEVEDFLSAIFMWNLEIQDIPAVYALWYYVIEHEDIFSFYFFGFVNVASFILSTRHIQEETSSVDPRFADKVEEILG